MYEIKENKTGAIFRSVRSLNTELVKRDPKMGFTYGAIMKFLKEHKEEYTFSGEMPEALKKIAAAKPAPQEKPETTPEEMVEDIKGTEQEVEAEIKRYRCKACGNLIDKGRKKCRKCGGTEFTETESK